MKAIITGANGFVGASVLNELINHGIEVLAIDISFANPRFKDHPNIKKLELSIEDIAKLETIVSPHEYSLFYHFAWIGSAGPLRMDEKVQIQNAVWTVECLKTASKIGCQKFIAAGSIMEFEVHEAIYTQGTEPGLPYIYGIGKVLAHELSKPIANSLGIELVWAYITNAYGVGEKSPRFINSTLRKMINDEDLVFTSGTQNYDFIYIDDVARAFLALGLQGKKNKAYIIGSGKARPLKDFITEMCQANCSKKSPIFGSVPFTGANVPIEVFSTKEIEEDCNFIPTVSFSEGTQKTLNWLKEVD